MYSDVMCVIGTFAFIGGISYISYFVFNSLLDLLWNVVSRLADWAGE